MGHVVRFGIMPWTSTAAQRMTHAPHAPAVRRWLLNAVLRTGSERRLHCWGGHWPKGGEGRPWSTGWTGGGWSAASDRPLKGHEQNRSLDALIFQKHHSGLCVEGLSSGGDFGGWWVLEVVAQDRASFLCKLGCTLWSTSWAPVLSTSQATDDGGRRPRMPWMCGFQRLLLLNFGVVVHMPVLCSFSVWMSSDSTWVF